MKFRWLSQSLQVRWVGVNGLTGTEGHRVEVLEGRPRSTTVCLQAEAPSAEVPMN